MTRWISSLFLCHIRSAADELMNVCLLFVFPESCPTVQRAEGQDKKGNQRGWKDDKFFLQPSSSIQYYLLVFLLTAPATFITFYPPSLSFRTLTSMFSDTLISLQSYYQPPKKNTSIYPPPLHLCLLPLQPYHFPHSATPPNPTNPLHSSLCKNWSET